MLDEQPDNAPFTWADFRRYNEAIVTPRLERIEGFLFEDTPERASLQTVARKVDAMLTTGEIFAAAARRIAKWSLPFVALAGAAAKYLGIW